MEPFRFHSTLISQTLIQITDILILHSSLHCIITGIFPQDIFKLQLIKREEKDSSAFSFAK